MAGPSNANPYAQSVDWLFAQLPGASPSFVAPAPSVQPTTLANGAARGEPGQAPSFALSEPPAAVGVSPELRAGYEWLQAERKRLEEYTRTQFATIQQQHQALLAKHFRSEEALTLRAQELNREMQYLASQTEALQRRDRELAAREQALATQMEQLAQAEEEILAMQRTTVDTQKDTEVQRTLLEKLRADTANLQTSGAAARAEFETFESTLKEHQAAWEEKQAQMAAHQLEMEKRYQAMQKDEEAVQRRLAELEE